MGLDMMLYRKKKGLKINYNDWEEINNNLINIGYWRKANAIHKFFVDKAQKGIDDCGYYEITKEIIQELHDKCKEIVYNSKLIDGDVLSYQNWDENGNKCYHYHKGKIIENAELCKDLLPTQDGFFFGTTEYNEYYLEDIKDTLKLTENILSMIDFETNDLIYHSSW